MMQKDVLEEYSLRNREFPSVKYYVLRPLW